MVKSFLFPQRPTNYPLSLNILVHENVFPFGSMLVLSGDICVFTTDGKPRNTKNRIGRHGHDHGQRSFHQKQMFVLSYGEEENGNGNKTIVTKMLSINEYINSEMRRTVHTLIQVTRDFHLD